MQPQSPQAPVPAIAQVAPAAEAGAAATAAQMYEAATAQRRVLQDQLESLESRRRSLSSRLEEPLVTGADRTGLDQRIAAVDQRIADVDKQIATSDMQVSRAAAQPGAIVEPPPEVRSGPPEEVYVLSGIFMVVVLLPLTIAYARRIWRRGATIVTNIPKELGERLIRVEQAVESTAVEVERIGEGQRFLTRLFTEGNVRAIAPASKDAVELRQRQLP